MVSGFNGESNGVAHDAATTYATTSLPAAIYAAGQ